MDRTKLYIIAGVVALIVVIGIIVIVKKEKFTTDNLPWLTFIFDEQTTVALQSNIKYTMGAFLTMIGNVQQSYDGRVMFDASESNSFSKPQIPTGSLAVAHLFVPSTGKTFDFKLGKSGDQLSLFDDMQNLYLRIQKSGAFSASASSGNDCIGVC